MDKGYEEVRTASGDVFRFSPISEWGKPQRCEPIRNIYPTSFMTPEEIKQRNQRRKDFEEYLKTLG